MRIYFLLIMGLIFPIYGQATIYKHVNKQGNMAFSDRPQAGAVEEKLTSSQSFSWPAKLKKTLKEQAKILDGKQHVVSKIKITSPSEDQYVRSNHGVLSVSVKIQPEIKKEERLQVFLDGKAFGDSQIKEQFNLSGIFRGKHTLQVRLSDNKSYEIAKSNTVSFYMHRNIVRKTSK